MVELKRCPFCGGEAEMWDDGYMRPVIDEGGAYVDMDIKSPDIYGVECTNPECFCQLIGFDSEAEAIAAWNRRTQNIGKKECCEQMTEHADICRECELTSKTRELERQLSEMAIEAVALTEENRVLKLRLEEEESE